MKPSNAMPDANAVNQQSGNDGGNVSNILIIVSAVVGIVAILGVFAFYVHKKRLQRLTEDKSPRSYPSSPAMQTIRHIPHNPYPAPQQSFAPPPPPPSSLPIRDDSEVHLGHSVNTEQLMESMDDGYSLSSFGGSSHYGQSSGNYSISSSFCMDSGRFQDMVQSKVHVV